MSQAINGLPAATGCLPDLHGRLVLVVADEAESRDLLFEMIELWGGRCLEAQNAAEALAIAQRLHIAGEPPDLIIIDLNSPCAQGVKTARTLAADLSLVRIPMLFLNGEPCPPPESAGLRGAFCVEKPLRLVDLQDAVSKVLCGRVFNFPRRTRAWLTTGRAAQALRILLLEDSPVNQKLTCTLLEKRGHEVTTTRHGDAALKCLQTQQFDLILMDAAVPGTDRAALTSLIRRGGVSGCAAGIPIVALSVHACDDDRHEMLAAGADACIAKPFTVQELLAVVERFARNDG